MYEDLDPYFRIWR